MALRFTCSECGQLHRVPESMGRRKLHCLSCGQPLVTDLKTQVADDAPVDQAAGELVLQGPLSPARAETAATPAAGRLGPAADADDAPLKMAEDEDGLPSLKDDAPPPWAKAPPPTPRDPDPRAAQPATAGATAHHPRSTTEPSASARSLASPATTTGAAALRLALAAAAERPPQKTAHDAEPLSLDDIASVVPDEDLLPEQTPAVIQSPPMPAPRSAPRGKSQLAADLGRGLLGGLAGLSKILDVLGAIFTTCYLIAVPIFIIAPWPVLAYDGLWGGFLLFIGIFVSVIVLGVCWVVCSFKIPGLWPGGWIGYLSTFIGIGLVGGIAATQWPPAINLAGLVSSLLWLGFVVNNWEQIAWKCGRWLMNCLASLLCLLLILGIGYVFPKQWIALPSRDDPRLMANRNGWSAQQNDPGDWQNTPAAEPAHSGWTRPPDPPVNNRVRQRPAPAPSDAGQSNIFDNPTPATPPRNARTERSSPGIAHSQPPPVTPPIEARPVIPNPKPPALTERPLPGVAPTPPASAEVPAPVSERPLPSAVPAVSPSPKIPEDLANPAASPALAPLPVRAPPVVDISPAMQLARLGADVRTNVDAEIVSVDLRGTSDVAAAATILAGSRRVAVLRLLPSQLTPNALPALKTIPSITRLEFSDVKIADADLARVAGLSNVDELSLAEQPITAAGIRALSPMANLKKLYLKGTKIDDTACPHLAKLTSLRYLDVTDTRLTSDGVEQLKPLKNLVGLILTHTDVSDAAQQSLKTSNPRLNIIPP